MLKQGISAIQERSSTLVRLEYDGRHPTAAEAMHPARCDVRVLASTAHVRLEPVHVAVLAWTNLVCGSHQSRNFSPTQVTRIRTPHCTSGERNAPLRSSRSTRVQFGESSQDTATATSQARTCREPSQHLRTGLHAAQTRRNPARCSHHLKVCLAGMQERMRALCQN